MLFIEQPLHRKFAVADQTREAFSAWTRKPAVIIDESDGELSSLSQALSCGYNGTSYKSCKGVFKGIANACRIRHLVSLGKSMILSGEDLANVGPVALLQDCVVAATLGIEHLERNGHHYFRGMSMFPQNIQRDLIRIHGDLYTQHDDGFATLLIRNGAISTKSLHEAPFGYSIDLPLGDFTRIFFVTR